MKNRKKSVFLCLFFTSLVFGCIVLLGSRKCVKIGDIPVGERVTFKCELLGGMVYRRGEAFYASNDKNAFANDPASEGRYLLGEKFVLVASVLDDYDWCSWKSGKKGYDGKYYYCELVVGGKTNVWFVGFSDDVPEKKEMISRLRREFGL